MRGGHEVAWAWRKLRVFAPVWSEREEPGEYLLCQLGNSFIGVIDCCEFEFANLEDRREPAQGVQGLFGQLLRRRS